MHTFRRSIAIFSITSIAFAALLPASFAFALPCVTGGPDVCIKSDKACTKNDECKGNVGQSICVNDLCYMDQTRLQEYQESTTVTTFGQDVIALKKPALEIKIPGLNFSDVAQTLDNEGYIHIPYIGEFLSAVYKYAMIVGSIIAVVMLIKNGVTIILSAGGEEQMASYHQIGQVLIGLMIMWGSFFILTTINPALTQFQALRVKYIESIPLFVYDKEDPASEPGASAGSDQPGNIKYECKTQPSNNNLTASTYDTLFQSYGACLPYDWRVLKAMSFVESAHRASVVNCAGFTGLFQTKTKYANSTLLRHHIDLGDPKDFESVGKVNPLLQQPEPSMMVGTRMILDSTTLITQACPKIALNDLYYFLYIGHQSGQGALKSALKASSCSPSGSQVAIQSFYLSINSKRSPSEIAVESDSGAKRFLDFITKLGVTDTASKPVDQSKCPLYNPSLRQTTL